MTGKINHWLRRALSIEVRRVTPPQEPDPAFSAPVIAQARRTWPSAPKSQIGICAIFKDEGIYLREWLEYHLLQGVERFYLYNNNSSDDYVEVLGPYVRAGIVQLTDWLRPPPCQKAAYNHCVEHYGHEVRWLGFIDMDEFVVPVRADETLLQVLRDYEEYPALAMHWLMFGPGNHILKPDGLVTENFTRCQAFPNKVVKIFVDPRRVSYISGAHTANFENGELAVNEDFKPVRENISLPPTMERIRLNHYWSKSAQEFFAKIERGNANKTTRHCDPSGLMMAAQFYDGAEETAILRFLPALREAMQKPPSQVGVSTLNAASAK